MEVGEGGGRGGSETEDDGGVVVARGGDSDCDYRRTGRTIEAMVKRKENDALN